MGYISAAHDEIRKATDELMIKVNFTPFPHSLPPLLFKQIEIN